MKCPKCGKELLIRNEKVSVSESGEAVFNQFAVCTDCKKKWNLDKQRAKGAEKSAAKKAPAKEAPVKQDEERKAVRRADAPVKRSHTAGRDTAERHTAERQEALSRREAPAKKISSDTTVRPDRPVSKNPQAKRPQSRPNHPGEPGARPAGSKASRQTYSNIPPKDVRKKREDEMKKGYDELLSIEDEERGGSKAPVIILIILIIAALAAAGTIFYCKLTDRPVPFISQAAPEETVITASIEDNTSELPEELQDVEF